MNRRRSREEKRRRRRGTGEEWDKRRILCPVHPEKRRRIGE
jgi:hypothetical protein